MKEKIQKKLKIKTVIYGAIIVVVAVVIFLIAWVYFIDSDGKIGGFTTKYLPLPAVYISGFDAISFNSIKDNSKSIQRFYESQRDGFAEAGYRVDFSTDEGRKRLKIRERGLINKMIEDKIIQSLAVDRGINISQDTVNQAVERSLNEYGTEGAARENLERQYGWTLEDFKEKIVRPSMYKNELEKLVQEDSKKINEAQKNKIGEARESISNGEDFSETAKQVSEGITAQEGGELGWFRKDQLIGDVADDIFSLKKGDISEVLESSLGYHIVKMQEKKRENDVDLVKIKQIFVFKRGFGDWLEEKMRDFKVNVLHKDYYWHGDDLIVEFSDIEMKEYEEKIANEISGDASLGT